MRAFSPSVFPGRLASRRLGRTIASVAVAACATVAGGDAVAKDSTKYLCATAAEQAQSLRTEGKLLDARARLVRCSQAECPTVVRRDCQDWLADLDKLVPTVVFGARDARGQDVFGVAVSVDDTRVVEGLDGMPVPVDPGPHTFRFVARGGVAVEERFLIRGGEKDRPLHVRFDRALTPDGVPLRGSPSASLDTSREAARTPELTEGERGTASAEKTAGASPLPWIVGGAGLAALGVSAVFDLRAWGVQNGCGATRTCASSDVDAARTDRTVAEVSLAVGSVALVAAAWLFLSRPATPPPRQAGR